jgi:hypothetical protein
MLASDGYILHVGSKSADGDELTLTVSAGPDACEECLVPVEVFTAIAKRHLADFGLDAHITVAYPNAPSSLNPPSPGVQSASRDP